MSDIPNTTPTRMLTPPEEAVVQELYDRKFGERNEGGKPTHAYVTITREISKTHAGRLVDPKQPPMVFPPGTTLKIVMVSRFGDCGVTDDLKADNGYFIRFQFDDPTIVDIRWQETPTKEWNEFLSGIIAKAAPNA